MIASLRGKLLASGVNRVTIDIRGVGYDVAVPLSTIAAFPEDGEVFLHVRKLLRENALELDGFIDYEEKALFEMLLGVTGVGPRLALAILSGISPEGFAQATLMGDFHRLVSIPGVGKKVADRIVMELKDKIAKAGLGSLSVGATTPSGTLQEELISSLINLGYKDSIARETARQVIQESAAGTSLEQALRIGLKKLVP